MIAVLQIGILVLVAAGGAAVALTRDPASQTICLSMFGLILTVMFTVFQAPDVALSQLVIGAVGLPLLLLLTLATLRRYEGRAKRSGHGEEKS